MTDIHPSHPAREAIIEAQLAFDRGIFRRYGDIQCIVRLVANGEYPWETMPIDFTLVQQMQIDGLQGRWKRQATGWVGMPTNKSGASFMLSAPVTGVVYLVRRRDEYKIGMTHHLPERLAQLSKTFNIDDLTHYILTDNPKRLERRIHQRMASWRTSGEWFRLPSSMLIELRTLAGAFMNHRYNDQTGFDNDAAVMSEISPAVTSLLSLPYIKYEDFATTLPYEYRYQSPVGHDFSDWAIDKREALDRKE